MSSLLFTLIDPLTRDTIHVNNRSYIAWKIFLSIHDQYMINTCHLDHRKLNKKLNKSWTHECTFANASRPYSASIKVWVFCITSPPAAMTLCERAVLKSFELIENKLAVSFKALLFSIISLSSSSLKVILPWKSRSCEIAYVIIEKIWEALVLRKGVLLLCQLPTKCKIPAMIFHMVCVSFVENPRVDMAVQTVL